jgi:hypothetical protein
MYDREAEKRTAELERRLAQAEARSRAPRPLPGSAGDLRRLLRLDGGPFDVPVAVVVVIVAIAVSGPFVTAILPQSGLWTSGIVCGEPGQLAIRTSSYSYKPGQSGISVNFQCLAPDGAHDASYLAISALQSVVIGAVLSIVAVVALLICRRRQRASAEWPVL